ncbi:hypothetical protein Btru_042761 [Bulinus truncatus]|nr:hypothetical protein Btru_042761 [Bulinus truncatus]
MRDTELSQEPHETKPRSQVRTSLVGSPTLNTSSSRCSPPPRTHLKVGVHHLQGHIFKSVFTTYKATSSSRCSPPTRTHLQVVVHPLQGHIFKSVLTTYKDTSSSRCSPPTRTHLQVGANHLQGHIFKSVLTTYKDTSSILLKIASTTALHCPLQPVHPEYSEVKAVTSHGNIVCSA